MDLKEAVAIFERPVNTTVVVSTKDFDEAINCMVAFCQTVLEAKGIPDRDKLVDLICGIKNCADVTSRRELCVGCLTDTILQERQAWLAKAVDVKNIRKIIDLYNSDKIDGSKMTWEEYRNQFAAAIVGAILGKEK